MSKPSPSCLKGKDLSYGLERTSLSPTIERIKACQQKSWDPTLKLAKTSDEFHSFIRFFKPSIHFRIHFQLSYQSGLVPLVRRSFVLLSARVCAWRIHLPNNLIDGSRSISVYTLLEEEVGLPKLTNTIRHSKESTRGKDCNQKMSWIILRPWSKIAELARTRHTAVNRALGTIYYCQPTFRRRSPRDFLYSPLIDVSNPDFEWS